MKNNNLTTAIVAGVAGIAGIFSVLTANNDIAIETADKATKSHPEKIIKSQLKDNISDPINTTNTLEKGLSPQELSAEFNTIPTEFKFKIPLSNRYHTFPIDPDFNVAPTENGPTYTPPTDACGNLIPSRTHQIPFCEHN